MKAIVREEFNFALFIKNLTSYRPVNIFFILRRIIKYNLNFNAVEPHTERNCLHLAALSRFNSVFYFLQRLPGIDSEKLDYLGFQPVAYVEEVPETLWITTDRPAVQKKNIRCRSKKLYNLLYHNITSANWKTSTFAHIIPIYRRLRRRQKDLILDQARDETGNTFLHFATKFNYVSIVENIINERPDLVIHPNFKGKLPFVYCRSEAMMNLYPAQNKWCRKYYIPNYQANNSLLVNLIQKFPDVVELSFDRKNYIVPNLKLLLNYAFHLDLDKVTMHDICKHVRDPMQNNCWHIFANSMHPLYNVDKIFDLLDNSVINERNEFGDTPLHVCSSLYVKEKLVFYGAHPDYLNNRGELAYKIVLNLTCISARNIPKNLFCHVPKMLKSFVENHHH